MIKLLAVITVLGQPIGSAEYKVNYDTMEACEAARVSDEVVSAVRLYQDQLTVRLGDGVSITTQCAAGEPKAD